MYSKNFSSMYKDLSKDTLDLMKKFNQDKVNTFLIPTRFISAENAQLAYLLNEYYNYGKEEASKNVYRSFFVNTRYEAFQGAIKLIRHNAMIRKRSGIVVLDPNEDLQLFINPFEKDQAEQLIPGLICVKTFEEVINQVNTIPTLAGVVLVNTGAGLSLPECQKVLKLCKEKGIITVFDDPDHVPGEEFALHKIPEQADMIVLGEALTNNEIPFGIFSMTAQVHKPWTSAQTCLFHSSTYSGNRLAVSKALNTLQTRVQFLSEDKIIEICNTIASSRDETVKYFGMYVNPGMVKFYFLTGYDFVCKKGDKSWLEVIDNKGESKKVLDAVAGGGAVIRGHCKEDIYTEVLSKHSNGVDYFSQLSDKLSSMLNFPHVFPAVSGATAVEIAMILTLLAAKDKKRVIVFKDNFAGNTLVSMIGTANKIFHQVFQPIYKNVKYIDPFAPDADKLLTSELEKGDVGLVWMEVFQGGTQKDIPENLLKIVQENKKKQGYFLGVDEILMGFYRIDKLTSYQDTCLEPDVVTFSKVLADGTYPMASTLVSEEIYHGAQSVNPNIVSTFENLYKNQFGAHIALNSIEKLSDPLTIEQIKHTSKILSEGLEQIKKRYPFITDICGKGHIYHISYKGSVINTYFCRKAVQEQNLFIYIDRIIPAITISAEDTKELIKRLNKVYSSVGNPFIFKIKSKFISLGIIKKLLF